MIVGARTPDDPEARGRVWIEDGRIIGVEKRTGRSRVPHLLPVIDFHGDWLLPGWMDLQVNDIAWLARGLKAPGAHAERIRAAARHQAERGVTGLVLATLAAPLEEIEAYLRGAAEVLRSPGRDGGSFLGVLVEGTFMNPEHHGAHNPKHVLAPSVAALERILRPGSARLINVAPEMGGDALAVIGAARSAGLVVGVGHAKPSGERVRAAVKAGLRYVIHWGNGPTGSSLKAFGGGGLLEEALRNDRLTLTVIADGVHLDRALVRDALARKGRSGLIAVSDAGFAFGPPSTRFRVYGIRGAVSSDGTHLRVAPERGREFRRANPHTSDAVRLFGSAVGMGDVFQNLLSWLTVAEPGVWTRLHRALPFLEALRWASDITSRNPARLLEMRDRGRIAPGMRADFLRAAILHSPGRARVRVKSVWVAGARVRPSTP